MTINHFLLEVGFVLVVLVQTRDIFGAGHLWFYMEKTFLTEITASAQLWTYDRKLDVAGIVRTDVVPSTHRSVTNRHPEMSLFPKTATQKDQKHPKFQAKMLFFI